MLLTCISMGFCALYVFLKAFYKFPIINILIIIIIVEMLLQLWRQTRHICQANH